MRIFLLLVMMSLQGLSGSGSTFSSDEVYKPLLAQISSPHHPLTQAEYIDLDRKLRQITLQTLSEPMTEVSWQTLSPLGIKQGHFSLAPFYDGRWLKKAHHINPHSAYREITLYSEIEESSELRDLPPRTQFNTYLAEFPKGPFAKQVHISLAYFYTDLEKALRLAMDGHNNYKTECLKSYLPDPLPRAYQGVFLKKQGFMQKKPKAYSVLTPPLKPGHNCDYSSKKASCMPPGFGVRIKKQE